MVEMTVQVSNSLAERIKPLGDWLPTIIELSVADFKTSAVASTAKELTRFLVENPSPNRVLEFEISSEAQRRVSRLLELNKEGKAGELENRELDEWEKFEHIAIMLSAKAAKILKSRK